MKSLRANAVVTPETPGWRDPSSAYRARSHSHSIWRFLMSFIVPPKYYRLRPTSAGFMLILVMIALGGAAYNTSSNILFMCLSLMMGCLVLSGLLSFINFQKLFWMFEAPTHLRANEMGLGRIWVENKKPRIPTFVLWFHVQVDKKRKKERVIMGERLDPGQRTALNWHIPSVSRGKAFLWISGVESQYPFGFLKKNIGVPIQKEVMVWPAKVEYRLSLGQGKRVLAGIGKNQCVGEGTDLSGLRDYRIGDDLRRVHWKASARSSELLLKEFYEENATGFKVWFQTAKSLWLTEENFERACALVGSIVEDLYRKGELMSFRLDESPPIDGRSASDFMSIMAMLSVVSLGQGNYHSEEDTSPYFGLTFKPGEGTEINIFLGIERVGTTIQ